MKTLFALPLVVLLAGCAGGISPTEVLNKVKITGPGLEQGKRVFEFANNQAGIQCYDYLAKRRAELDTLYKTLPPTKERDNALRFAIDHSIIEIVKAVRNGSSPVNFHCGALYAQVRTNTGNFVSIVRRVFLGI